MESLFLLDGSWCIDSLALQQEALTFYKNLFAPLSQHQSTPMDVGVHVTLCDNGRASLLAPVTKDEVFCALKSMKSFKAPGPDGFQPFFFKTY